MLVIALVVGAASYLLKGNAGLIQNVSGTVKAPVQRMVSSVADWLESLYGYLYDYDQLVAENERLRAELTQAQEEARNGAAAIEENERFRQLLNFKEKHSDMTLESAKVVAWTTSNWANSFTISKGTNADIAVGDCVITEYGVMVGQVTEVGSTWATVSTVIDLNTNIGALVSENGASGLLVGDFAMMQEGCVKLSYLADGAQVFSGDTVMTSGSGGAFPQGLVAKRAVFKDQHFRRKGLHNPGCRSCRRHISRRCSRRRIRNFPRTFHRYGLFRNNGAVYDTVSDDRLRSGLCLGVLYQQKLFRVHDIQRGGDTAVRHSAAYPRACRRRNGAYRRTDHGAFADRFVRAAGHAAVSSV